MDSEQFEAAKREMFGSVEQQHRRIDAIANEAIEHFGEEPFVTLGRLWDNRRDHLIAITEEEEAKLADYEDGPMAYGVAAYPVASAFVRSWLRRAGRDIVDTSEVMAAAVRLVR